MYLGQLNAHRRAGSRFWLDLLKPVRSRARIAHPNIIKGHDNAGVAVRDRLPAFDKTGTSNRLWAAGAILRSFLDD
jgi:hypothetical protein